MTRDPEREIAERIVAAIEAGTPPWRRPWTGWGGGLSLRHNGEAYRGINVLAPWCGAATCGYASPYWMTYRQAQELGGEVRGRSKATITIKYGVREAEGEDGREERRPYLKTNKVFNADQIDGLPESSCTASAAADLGTRPDEGLEACFGRLGATIETTPEPRATYHPGRDVILMPPIGTFHTTAGYCETLGHEAAHWTGGEKRPDRIKRFADRAAYAFEDLVAEVGQCLLFARLGLTPSIDQSAAYVEGWLKALRNDKRAIFRAAGEAQKAVDLIREQCGHGAATTLGNREAAA